MARFFRPSFITPAACLLLLAAACAECLAQASALAESTRALYRGEPRRAAELAEKHLRKYPNDAPVRVMLARAELAQGKFQRADEELRKALRSDPRNIDGLYYLAVVARALAQEEYRRLYALAPDSERVHQLLGEAALAQENQPEAEAEFQAALRVNPRSVAALVALGELKRSQSKFDEAIAYYAEAERVGPLDYNIAYGLGASYTYKQDHQRAVEYLRRAAAFAPDSAAARFALGNALFQGGQMAAAIPELEFALSQEPRLKQALFLLGRAYQRVGRPAEAKAAFARLDELNRSEAAGKGLKPGGEAAQKPAASKPGAAANARPRQLRRKP